MKLKTLFAGSILLLSTLAFGQAIPQFSSVEPHQYDSVNLGTLGIQLNVPIRSKAGHIPYSYRLIGTSLVSVVNGQSSWLQASPLLTGGEAHVMRGPSIGKTSNCYDSNHELQGISYSSFYVTDADGATHPFLFTIGTPLNACNSPTHAGGYAADNSGLYLYADASSGSIVYTMHDISGDTFPSGSITDPNGNTMTPTIDSLGQTAITVNGSSYSWTDALGNNQAVTLTKTPYTLYTAFGCPIDGVPGSNYPFPTSISFPDGSSLGLSWEANALNNADKTGRIASITLPTGGTISYAYSGGTNGINCIDGTPATMKRTTPDGTWTYTHVPPSAFVCGTTPTATTTVQDPQGNNTVYTFNVGACPIIGPAPVRGITLEAERQVYNGGVAPGNLLETVITCYNNTSSSPTNCPAYAGNGVSEKDVYTTYPGVTGYSAVKTAYDSFGRVADVKTFDFNAANPTNEKVINYGSGNPTSQTCTAISTYIIDKPCSVTLKDSTGNILSQTWNTYDGNGNLTQTWNLVSGSGASGVYLSKSYTYSTTAPFGVVQTSTDVNGQVMNYTTTSCNNMFVTSRYPTNFSNLQTSQTWDCNGGVVTSATNANGQTTQTKFFVNSNADPFYRPVEDIDQLGYITSLGYPTPSSTESVFTFNSGQSVIDDLSTTDSIGRPVTSQLLQGPGSSSWDTKSRSFDSDGHVLQTSLPCVSTRGTGCTASTESQTYDGLNRPLVHTGTGGDIVTKTYPANDVLTKLTPVPTGEHLKSTQKEYDGLGRLKSVCVISSATGSASCGQTTAATGFLTTYSYDAAGRLLQTVENAQATSGPNQTRSYTYDKLGRVLTESNPESGNIQVQYTYDLVSNAPACTSTSTGDLVQEKDANGNYTCHHYDTLHRETYTTYTGPNSNNVSKYFVYDSATVNGVAMNNVEGRMAEAYTCSGNNAPPCSPKITDEGFSYDKRGQMADYYQSSPNSITYYHISATRWEDGGMQTVSGVGLPIITYGDADADAGLDGEGRVTQVSASTGTNPVSAVTYNTANNSEPVGALLTTTLGLGDTQNFTYDKNTGRMTQYSASVGATPTVISGSLSWNSNGTLLANNIVDGYNAADTQNCSYLYDDFIRASSVNCLNGSTNVWNQTFTYGTDAFGNLTKNSSGPGLIWNPGYNSANNHYTLANTAYDNNGNLTDDTFHSYTWLADGHEATIGPSAHGIDPTTTSTVYDAMGNKVEETVNGTTHEYVSAFGVDAQMTGQTENSTLVGLPGGVQALYSGGTLRRFRFPDWEGTIRAESNPNDRVFSESLAFAPFGERYATKGTPFNVDSFTGKPDQLVSDEYDFAAREEHNAQGRWVSPDPMSGTGNKYVYADNNPLSNVDVYGLFSTVISGADGGGEMNSESEAPDYATFAESHPPVSAQTGGHTGQAGDASKKPDPCKTTFCIKKVVWAKSWDDATRMFWQHTWAAKSTGLRWVANHPKTVKTIFVSGQVITALSGILDEGASELALPEEEAAEKALETAAEDAVESAEASEGASVLQSGGNTLSSSTAKSLNETFGENLQPREWGRALEKLKDAEQIPNNVHGKLLSNGDFVVDNKVVGNISGYIRGN